MDRVARALERVPRADFLPAGARRNAGFDGPIPIGHGQTNSQPATVRNMLELLDVRAGQRVLDVGAGSGWTTALLAELTGPRGRVVGLELETGLAEWGAQNLARSAHAWASLAVADPDRLGEPAQAPYDRILVSAMARRVPPELLDQLGCPGRMVLPVDGRMTLVVREAGGDRTSRHGSYRFVPLR